MVLLLVVIVTPPLGGFVGFAFHKFSKYSASKKTRAIWGVGFVIPLLLWGRFLMRLAAEGHHLEVVLMVPLMIIAAVISFLGSTTTP